MWAKSRRGAASCGGVSGGVEGGKRREGEDRRRTDGPGLEGGSSEDAEDAADEGKVTRGAEKEGFALER